MAEPAATPASRRQNSLKRIQALLGELYEPGPAARNFRFLTEALDAYLSSRGGDEPGRAASPAGAPGQAYAHLDGRVFAICYPDNVWEDSVPTLQTLEKTLSRWFPAVNGLHLLPERPMSHGDLWPQDLFDILSPEAAADLVGSLQAAGVLGRRREVADGLEARRAELAERLLPAWYTEHAAAVATDEAEFRAALLRRLEAAYDSHFNDGGFSQKTRAMVDPRFGGGGDLRRLSERYALMLDYVVNHLDIDNELLDAFRRGESNGEAFIIVSPERYAELKREGLIAKTFRPRPFPLFTGLRKTPPGPPLDPAARAREMNRRLRAGGCKALDPRLIAFLAIAFKLENDQGLTAGDRRVLTGFRQFLGERGVAGEALFADSEVQPQQPVFRAGMGLPELCAALEVPAGCAELFARHEEEIFGEKFYIYTTFSESQVDITPAGEAGFRLVIADLFHLLSGGRLAMMRMDAIKYLWKEIGGRNFDMEEGNRLIEVIRLLLSLAEPRLLPLDEVNSPDPVVYAMGKGGGFAYLFGQVNAVPAAFNQGSLAPLEKFMRTMKALCPPDLVLFVMLSTHDGRSVQGLGVQRADGYLSIAEFYRLREVIAGRGGKPKFRSVPAAEIPADTLGKVCAEAGLEESRVRALFQDAGAGANLRLRRVPASRAELLEDLAAAAGREAGELAALPAVDFFLEWVAEGRTVYELCCTSRSAFAPVTPEGRPLSAEQEAARLALAQLYVLTLAQAVPAIYFNDLLGLENDQEGYEASGKPRDLNRHRSALVELEAAQNSDAFSASYRRQINAVLAARTADRAFYPGSPAFEFRALSDTVFLHHPYARGRHSFIVGNISERPCGLSLRPGELEGVDAAAFEQLRRSGLTDALTGRTFAVSEAGGVELELPGYTALWLQASEDGARDGK
jgi:hypothetical protein